MLKYNWDTLISTFEKFKSANLVNDEDDVLVAIGQGANTKYIEGVRMGTDGKLVLVITGNDRQTVTPKAKPKA